MKVTTKGQVTIPQHIRRFLGIAAYSEVDFEIKNDEVVLVKLADKEGGTSSQGRFRRLRGLKRDGLTTEEWMTATRGG